MLPILILGIAGAADQSARESGNSPAYTIDGDVKVTLNPDATSTTDKTVRLKILRESAIRNLAQQAVYYSESVNPHEIVEAYTEKASGRRVDVALANILTRDAAVGLNAVYQRDSKVKTIIYPDVEVGDTLVMSVQIRTIDQRWAGQFADVYTFARGVPYASYKVTVDIPRELDLRSSYRGEGITFQNTSTETGTRLVFDYRAPPLAAEEPGAVSFLDYDPQFVMTTFKSMEELGASYWTSMRDKFVITPELQALADDLTKGIEGKRDQAVVLDHWVKKNIRYVLVYLGSGGITPNPAASVLANKYGDCKDHTVLLGTLLKAKGIEIEPALINLNTMYKMPDLPVPRYNHIMLYLPEFGIYDDPTASTAAFGVLPSGSYDKPVLHLTDAGGRAARTPAMTPDSNTDTVKTVAFVSADGSISGETKETSTGIFASALRTAALNMQAQGQAKYAENVIRNWGRVGTGVFDTAAPYDYNEPYGFNGRFKLSEKLEMPLVGGRDLPIGMPINGRNSIVFFGRRLPGRKADFVCHAGKITETIEVTFAEGLPMPKPLGMLKINNRYLTFLSESSVQGRVLRVHREFASLVPSQVCPASIEAEIAPSLQAIDRNVRLQMVFAAAVKAESELD